MPLDNQQQDVQQEHRPSIDRNQASPTATQSVMPPQMGQQLQETSGDAKGIVKVIQEHPDFQEPALEWVEANHGLPMRSEVSTELKGGGNGNGNGQRPGASYTVSSGDSLSAIARATLGDPGRWREIYELNKDVIGANPNKIHVGQDLVLPVAKTGDPAASKVEKITQETVASAPAPEAKTDKPGDDKPAAQTKAPSALGAKDETARVASVSSQFGVFAQNVAARAKGSVGPEKTPAPAPQAELGQVGKERFEKQGPMGPRDRMLFEHSDPLLGQFQVILGLDGDLSAQAHQKFFTITSAGGLTIKTPNGMSDLVINKLSVNLETMAVNIVSVPEIGPLERKILTQVLRETLLANIPQMMEQGKSPVAKAMENVPKTEDGQAIAYEWKEPVFGTSVVQMLLSPDVMVGVNFSNKGLVIDLFPGLDIKIPGPDYKISKLKYDFATAEFGLEQQGATTVLGVIGDTLKKPVLNGVASLGSKWFKGKLPAVMRAPGYDPTLDQKLPEHMDELYKNLTGVSMMGKKEGGAKPGPAGPETEQTTAPKGAAGATGEVASKAATDTDQVLYQLQSKELGAVKVCLDKDDTANIYKDAKSVGLDTKKGLYLKVPGHDWVQDIRLKGIRYDLESKKLDFEASDKIGEFVRSIVEDLVNAYVLPKLPGDVAAGLGVGGLEKGATHQTLYAVDTKEAGRIELLLEAGDRLNISKSATSIEVSAAQGMIIKAGGLPSVADLRITRIAYELGSGKIVIDAQKDVGPLVEKVATQLVKHLVVPQLPGGLEGLGLAGPGEESNVDPGKLKSYPTVAFSKVLPSVGKVEVRLAAGDTLGVGATGDRVRVYGNKGILIVAPDVGLDVNLTEIGLNYESGQVFVEPASQFGAFETGLMSDLSKMFLLPMIEQHYKKPTQDKNASHTVLYHYADNGVALAVCLEKGDEVKVEKNDKSITLSSGKGIQIIGDTNVIDANIKLNRVHLDLATGAVTIDSKPDIGQLGEKVATQLVRTLLLPHLPPELALIGIGKETGKDVPTEVMPEPHGLMLYEGSMGSIGKFDVSIAGESGLHVGATATTVDIKSDSGLLVRIPGLNMAVTISHVVINTKSGDVEVTSSTPLGAMENEVVDKLFAKYGMPMVSKYVGTADQRTGESPDFDVLYQYSDPKMGAFSVCVAKGEGLRIDKGEKTITLSSASGLFVTGLDWLPKFKLHKIEYELGTGRFNIDVSGIAQGHYVEGQDVGAITQDVIANIVKAVVVPHLPPQAADLGIVGFSEEEEAADAGAKGIKLHETEVGGIGKLIVSLSKGDALAITATDKEAMFTSRFGLIVDMPALHTQARISSLKYHFETGEVQLDGLGAFENAMIEAAMVEFVTPLLPAKMQGGPTPVGALLESMPEDRKGRRQLVEGTADIYMMANTRFDIGLNGRGLKFTANPAMRVDGPAAFNYEFKKLDFDFSVGKFKVDIGGDNILASIFTGVARGKAEKLLNETLLPLLPPEMLRPGYDLFQDPDMAEKMAIIVKNFGSIGAVKK